MGGKSKKPRRKGINAADDRGAFCPTPAAIAAATARIRESWDDAEHHRRAGLPPQDVFLKEHSARDLAVV